MKLNLKILASLIITFATAHQAVAMESQVEGAARALQKAMSNNDIGGIIERGANEIGKSSFLQEKEIVKHVTEPLEAINQGLDICIQYAKKFEHAAKSAKEQVTAQLAEQQYKASRAFASHLQSLYKAVDKFFDLKNMDRTILIIAQFLSLIHI